MQISHTAGSTAGCHPSTCKFPIRQDVIPQIQLLSKHRRVRIYMTESSVFPVWRNSQFIHHCSDASVNDKGVNRKKEQNFENIMSYVIKNPFLFSENSFISNRIEKSTQ